MPGLTSIDLRGSTCTTLSSAEACYLPIDLDGGNGTSTSLQISSATNLSRSGTTRGIQMKFTARQMSSNLASGTGATLTYRSNVGPFIPEDCVEAGNGASIDFQISSATDMSRSGTTRGMQMKFSARQMSNNLAGGTGATLTCHVDSMPEDYVSAGKHGNVAVSNHENSSSSKTCTDQHSRDSRGFDTSANCSKTSVAALDLEVAVADIGGDEGFCDDSIECVLSFQRCGLSGLPHHLTRIVICPQLFSVCRRCADAFLRGRTVLGQYQ